MNPHRPKGTGRGTLSAWRNSRIEDESGVSGVIAPENQDQRLKLVVRPEKSENPPKVSEIGEGAKDLSAALYHESPRITTQRNDPVLAKKTEEGDLFAEEMKKYPDNVVKAVSDVLSQANRPEKGKKEPKYFFEKTLNTAIGNTYRNIMKGLDLARDINSGGKKWKIEEGADKRKVSFDLLKKIFLLNPDSKEFLAEIKRLNDFRAYDLKDLRDKIDTHHEIVALKSSDKPDDEKQKEYEKLAGNLIGHEVREIFRNDQIAGTGEAVKIALHLESVVHKGLVKIVDQAEEATKGKLKNEFSDAERKIRLVEEFVSGQIDLLLKREGDQESNAYNAIKRHSKAKRIEMSDDEAGEVVARFAADRDNIAKGISALVDNELKEKTLPYNEEKITGPAFINARKKLIEYLNVFLAGRKVTEPKEVIENKELEIEFTPEEEKLLEVLAETANETLREELKEAKKWSGKWTPERVFAHFKPVFEASAEEIMEKQNFPKEKMQKALEYIFSKIKI